MSDEIKRQYVCYFLFKTAPEWRRLPAAECATGKMTKRSMYVDKHEHPGSEGRRGRVVPGQSKYIFIYPFWKTTRSLS